MADYHPLISRAVAGLEKNNGENRRALYERARAALLAQLRGVTPALNESDITRERLALEESIRKVEAEAARQFVEPTRQQQPPPAPKGRPAESRPPEARQPEARVPESRTPEPRQSESRFAESRSAESRSAEARQWDDAESNAPPPRRYVNPPSQNPLPQEPRVETLRRPRPPQPPTMPDPRQSDSIFDQPLPSEAPPAAQPPQARHPLRRPATDRRSLSDSGLKDFRNVVSEANELGGASARAEKSAREAYAAVPAPAPEDERPVERSYDRTADRSLDRSGDRAYERPARSYERPQPDRSEPRMFDSQASQERMFEPQVAHEPRPHEDFSEPMLESSFALDDQHPVSPRTRRGPPPPIEDELGLEEEEFTPQPRRSYRNLIVKGALVGAIVLGLAGLVGLFMWQWPNMVALYRSFKAPAVETVREPPPANTRPKITDRIEPGGQPASPAPTTPGAAPAAAVAQKVVLYEEDPADPQGKRFVGSAIWRTETVTPGPGQPPELAIRADVEVPERKLAMTWSLRRNTDKNLPATHTIEVMFKTPADFPSGGIANVPGILMKAAEQTKGVPLAGAAVKVLNGYFMIALSNADPDKERNLQLLKERGWFDVPVVYGNNRRAILAVEKGTPGERAFAEAFKAWKQ
jgi:hypothetical protein